MMNGERKQKDSRLFGGAAKFGSKMYLLALFGLLVLSLLWFAPQKAFTLATAGNGPAGVGVTNGASTLELWLRADKGVFSQSNCTIPAATGNSVGCWQDQSGNGAHATNTNTLNQPTFNTGSLNNQPTLYFNGSQTDALVSGAITLDQFTIFSVFNSTGADGFVYEQGSDTGTNNGNNLFSGTECSAYIKRDATTSGLSLGAGWMNATYAFVANGYNGSHSSHSVSKNDLLISATCTYGVNDPVNPMTPVNVNDVVYIGARSGSGLPFTGNLTELIFFNENLPDVQKILVENYLSSKYNIAFDVASTNDHYDGDTPANGDFDLDVAGIGRFGVVSHTEAQAAGMVVVNGTFLNADGDWLLFGHNVATNINTTADLPTDGDWDGVNDQRWLRSFYFDRTDAGTAGGTVDVIFDFSDGGMTGSPAGTATNYRLLTRAGATGTFAEIAGVCVTGTSIAGDRVTFSGVDVTCLGSNFTLGTIDVANSPTAVSLQPIVATPQTNGLLIFAACVLALGFGSLWACLRHRPE
ncbi:MAG: hypothetical protein IPG51_15955 [Chloroflexi bacterium]|nr:hypothetical protein [Chloroflexota bacterium]